MKLARLIVGFFAFTTITILPAAEIVPSEELRSMAVQILFENQQILPHLDHATARRLRLVSTSIKRYLTPYFTDYTKNQIKEFNCTFAGEKSTLKELAIEDDKDLITIVPDSVIFYELGNRAKGYSVYEDKISRYGMCTFTYPSLKCLQKNRPVKSGDNSLIFHGAVTTENRTLMLMGLYLQHVGIPTVKINENSQESDIDSDPPTCEEDSDWDSEIGLLYGVGFNWAQTTALLKNVLNRKPIIEPDGMIFLQATKQNQVVDDDKSEKLTPVIRQYKMHLDTTITDVGPYIHNPS